MTETTPEPLPTDSTPADQAARETPEVCPAGPMTEEQLAEARRYGRESLAWDLVDRAVDLVFLCVAAFVLARPIDAYLAQFPIFNALWLRLPALLLAVLALHYAVSMPLSFYSGHVLEHRYKLSRLSAGAWLWRYAKTAMLTVGLYLAIFQGLYGLIWSVGPYWWLPAAAGFFAVSVLIGQLAPVLILPLFFSLKRLEDGELSERLNRLAAGTGLSLEGVYRMSLSDETAKANAMLAGLGRTRRVILGDTLLDGFSNDEIEVIFAHEIGHHVHRHIRKMIGAGLVLSLGGFFISNQLIAAWLMHSEGQINYHTLPVYTVPLFLLIVAVLSTLVEPLQNAVSRHFERQSDRYALARTGNPQAYRSAFQKLARQNKADPDPHPVEVLLFHGHPPIGKRLAMADEHTAADGETKEATDETERGLRPQP